MACPCRALKPSLPNVYLLHKLRVILTFSCDDGRHQNVQ